MIIIFVAPYTQQLISPKDSDTMHILVLLCGDDAVTALDADTRQRLDTSDFNVAYHELPALPKRKDLAVLDAAAKYILPVDTTPSLDEIAARPDVEHMGSPAPAPQKPQESLRFIVVGDDAALSAVMTRMMRGDYLWAELAYLPTEPRSHAARNWGIPEEPDAAWDLAVHGAAQPTPTLRTDAGIAVAGSATIEDAEGRHFYGEIIVDDAVLSRGDCTFGARLAPMLDAPGVAAVTLEAFRPSLLEQILRPFRKDKAKYRPNPDTLLTGRAVQAGGDSILVTVDGVPAKRPVNRVTFYRHLRDLQAVRPA